MRTYEERTQQLIEKVAHKKKVRRTTVASLSSAALVCVVALAVTLAFLLPTAGNAPTNLSNGKSSPNGDTVVYADDVSNAVSDDYSHVLAAFDPSTYTGSDRPGNITTPKPLDFSISNEMLTSDSGIISSSSVSSASAAYPFKLSSSGNVASLSEDDGESYIENTNVQVAGVKEGDMLKESTHYFYRLRIIITPEDVNTNLSGQSWSNQRRLQLELYRKAGKATVCNASFMFLPFGPDVTGIGGHEMFMSDDCRTVYVLSEAYVRVENTDEYRNEYKTSVAVLDISDLSNIRLVSNTYIGGTMQSARLIGDKLLVFTDYVTYRYSLEDPTTLVPYVEVDGERISADSTSIACPTKTSSFHYLVLTEFEKNGGTVNQCAVMGTMNSYSEPAVVYVSTERAYVSIAAPYNKDKMGTTTNITCIDFGGDGLHLAGTFTLEGRVANQYWLDEKDGVLRVASTVEDYVTIPVDNNTKRMGNNANLTCFAVDTWNVVGKVMRFAPEGESVRSVRFVNDKVYICTAEVTITRVLDPVYCFDLSDYAHITAVDTGEIEGYSGYLVPFADGTVLGLGRDSDGNAKFDVYKETDTDVETLSSLVLGSVEPLDDKGSRIETKYLLISNYKSFSLNATKRIVALPCHRTQIQYTWVEGNKDYRATVNHDYLYVIMVYENGQLRVADEVYPEGYYNYFRSAIADEYLYIFGVGSLDVMALSDLY